MAPKLPTRFGNPGNVPTQAEETKTNPAHLEAPQKTPYPPTKRATIIFPYHKLWLPLNFIF